jgi:hypothetical protein
MIKHYISSASFLGLNTVREQKKEGNSSFHVALPKNISSLQLKARVCITCKA